jgi:DNA-binding Xre family transcriptional regulator
MAVRWTLRELLATQHGVFTSSQLQMLIREKTRRDISLRELEELFKGPPDIFDFDMMQVLCNALKCALSDFCRVTPDEKKPPDSV